jgi:putative membrane protein
VRPSELIGAEGRRRIEAAVREAESGTRGEIVIAVTRACDEYGAAGWRCAVLLAVLAFLAAAVFAPPLPLLGLLAVQAAAFAAGHALARSETVRRWFVAEEALEQNAEQYAWSAFARHGVRHTEGATGILIAVALFERRVVVLADKGVNAVLEPGESWGDVVAIVLEGIRSDDPVGGICRAVARCGEILSHPLPPDAEPVDEIPHGLIVED